MLWYFFFFLVETRLLVVASFWYQAHLIVTATKIIIMPTDSIAIMTPHIIQKFVLGSSGKSKKFRKFID